MAAAATFYIDTPDFENATTVFSDAALTTCAANGFYQIGDVVREQVDCVGGLGPVIGMGGMRITPALTLGRVVGRNIATDQVSQEQTLENADRIPANKMKIPVVDA